MPPKKWANGVESAERYVRPSMDPRKLMSRRYGSDLSFMVI
jgi:hypothetical protein